MVELDHIILKVDELDKSGVFYISVFDSLKLGERRAVHCRSCRRKMQKRAGSLG